MGLGGPDVRYLVETAEHVARVESRLAGLWPGYWEAGRPFIVYHPDQAVLLVMDGPAPEDFVTLERVPVSLRGRAHVRAGRLRGLDGNIDLAFRVGTREVTAVPYRTSPGGTLHILFHEAFHATQAHRFRESALRSLDDASSVTRPEVADLLEAERRLLVAALVAAYPVRPHAHPFLGRVALGPPDEVRRLVLDYLAVRGRRTAGLPEAVVASERYQERIEGTATQVAFEATLLALGRAREEAAQFLVEMELAEPNAPRSPPSGGAILKSRAYGTGAAMGFLLDRLGAAWREDVESGLPLDLLVARAVGFDDLEAEAREQRARAATERVGRRWPGHAAARMSEAKAPAREDGRVRVDVEIPMVPGGRRPRVAINTSKTLGYTGGVFDGPAVLADLGTARLVSVVGDGVSLVARGHPVWVDRRDPSRFVVRVLLPDWPTVNGVDPRVLPHGSDGPLVLEGADFEARVDVSGTVTVESDRLVVRVGKP